ncbi:MAG: aminodeoxychorismate/anthranilate synthase component II [Vampirovibrio sp.]|nr:aminodeoxychorismate/anthranilate synthase component II [Vampirovibrio sp.]
MTVLLIDNYDSFTFNLYQLMQAETQATVVVVRNDADTLAGLLATYNPTHIVLSPGPGHPDEPKDFGVCAALIRQLPSHKIPMLGVCLGHQGMASIFGGKVISAPAIVHGKTSLIEALLLENGQISPLFSGLSVPFEAMRYHSLVVEESNFPHDVLEITAKDKTHGLIMGLQHRTLPLYGVQFHPESIGTPEGHQLLHNFLAL